MKLKYFLFLVIIFGCNQVEEPGKEVNVNESNPSEKKIIAPTEFNYDGVWIMTNYLDSIEKNKTIAKYRMLPASWFGILLKLEKDSLKAFGSIHNREYVLKKNNPDSLCVLDGINGKYLLSLNQETDQLELISIDDKKDTVKYVFRKRPEMKILIGNLDKYLDPGRTGGFLALTENFIKYFDSTLIAGRYFLNEQEINFGKTGHVDNFKNYHSYSVDIYFGTSHPFNNLDVLTVKTETGDFDYWNWKFDGENLILTKFSVDHEKYNPYELTNESYRLTKKMNPTRK